MFAIHEDKENSQLAVLNRGLLLGNVTAGKTFQQASGSLKGKAVQRTTRSVLEDVKNVTEPLSQNINRGLSQPQKTKPAAKPLVSKESKDSETTRRSSDVRRRIAPLKEIPEPEFADIPAQEEDTYDDIWPLSERPTAYLSQLLHWRPTSLAPCTYTEENDAAEELTFDDCDLSEDAAMFLDTTETPKCCLLPEVAVPLFRVPSLEDFMASDSILKLTSSPH